MRFDLTQQELGLFNYILNFYVSKNSPTPEIKSLVNSINKQLSGKKDVIDLVQDKKTGIWGVPPKVVSTVHASTSGK